PRHEPYRLVPYKYRLNCVDFLFDPIIVAADATWHAPYKYRVNTVDFLFNPIIVAAKVFWRGLSLIEGKVSALKPWRMSLLFLVINQTEPHADAAKVTVNEPKIPDGTCYLELKVPSRSRRDGCWKLEKLMEVINTPLEVVQRVHTFPSLRATSVVHLCCSEKSV
ncbi:hypothetical protein Tco_0714816, partial [Tanacetum coccineum]